MLLFPLMSCVGYPEIECDCYYKRPLAMECVIGGFVGWFDTMSCLNKHINWGFDVSK